MNILILFSGGIDSTALINYYLNLKCSIILLWIDYGQTSSNMEEKAAGLIAEHYNVELRKIKLGIENPKKNGYEYMGRNLLLFSVGLIEYPFENGLISSGIRYNSTYSDCSELFITKINKLCELLSNGTIVLDSPFKYYTKPEIFKYCIQNQIPLNLTYSCDNGTEKPCKYCPSCVDIIEAKRELKNDQKKF